MLTVEGTNGNFGLFEQTNSLFFSLWLHVPCLVVPRTCATSTQVDGWHDKHKVVDPNPLTCVQVQPGQLNKGVAFSRTGTLAGNQFNQRTGFYWTSLQFHNSVLFFLLITMGSPSKGVWYKFYTSKPPPTLNLETAKVCCVTSLHHKVLVAVPPAGWIIASQLMLFLVVYGDDQNDLLACEVDTCRI